MSRPGTTPKPQDSALDKRLEPYLTPQQLAELLQVSVKSIYRWSADDPTMPVLRTGSSRHTGAVRFPRERVLAWLRSREQGVGRHRQSRKQVLSAAESSRLRVVGEGDSGSCAHSCAPEAS